MSEGTKLDLAALGFTREELQERVVERCVKEVLTGVSYDEDGEELDSDSMFARKLHEKIRGQIDATAQAICEKHVMPIVLAHIEGLVLQKTTTWGEKQGEPIPFTSYLVQRAEAYLTETVTHDGSRPDHYSKGTQTRITQMVDKHLHYSIESAMKQAVEAANGAIVKGIEETVKLKLAEFSTALKVAVEVKKK